MHRFVLALALNCLALSVSTAAPTPPAIFTDPPPDKGHPATMTVLHIPVNGTAINGIAYVPNGPGPHPVLVICHGLPGNEKNLDLAQAVRRAGWVAVTFNYRGSWGSSGTFSFSGNLEDAAAVLAYLREPATAQLLRADSRRIVVAGHSMGGWVTAKTAESDGRLAGAILISAADLSRLAGMPHGDLTALMADNMESLSGVTPESMAKEVETNGTVYGIRDKAAALKDLPMLVLTSDDGLAPGMDALVAEVRAHGGRRVTAAHVATDHGWSGRRIELESRVIRWLQTLR